MNFGWRDFFTWSKFSYIFLRKWRLINYFLQMIRSDITNTEQSELQVLPFRIVKINGQNKENTDMNIRSIQNSKQFDMSILKLQKINDAELELLDISSK